MCGLPAAEVKDDAKAFGLNWKDRINTSDMGKSVRVGLMGMAKFKQVLLEMPVRPLSRHTELSIQVQFKREDWAGDINLGSFSV